MGGAARESLSGPRLSDDLDGEVEEGRLVEELTPIIRPIGEEMLEPRPALADRVGDGVGTGGIRDVGGREINMRTRPSASTATWRLGPVIFLPAS